ncbi:chromosomal replication initiator protein DnaA [Candidatus Dependentiae bacterium]|nr:chromosomal replication initiator protein DnaA [Candidatus Dependentiae bacterium]MCC7415186.1 chromosomal replication initiator protein DnaA [Campylobacterota bacterium]
MLAGIWEEFLTIAREEAGSRVVETWFKAVTLQRWDALNKVVYLQAPNHFVCDWVQSSYGLLLQEHLGRLFNVVKPKIVITTEAQKQKERLDRDHAAVLPAESLSATLEPTHANKLSINRTPGLGNKNYSFSSFVVGPSNALAYAAAQAVAQNPGTVYNPLFLFGGSGLGKTHLLHAIGQEIQANNPKAIILYQPIDRFVTEFISAIRFDRVHKFREKYKAVDVLLVDDIQFISNKEQTQEAFFHIFNALYETKKQIVFSSDTVPANIEGLAERLRSRLAWGLVADIYAPSLETKIAIIKKKADYTGQEVPDDVASFIASYVVSNVRELEGALIRVMAFASLTNQSVTIELAKKVLMRRGESHSHLVDFDSVIRCLSKHYPYSLEELRSKGRGKDLASVRQIAMFLMKKVTGKSLRDVGHFLGGRDHSTVMHAVGCIERRALADHAFGELLRRIEQEVTRS